MIVPFAKGQQAALPQAKPSETAMLMAIAQMQQAGAFKTAAAGTPKVIYTDKPPKQDEPANMNAPMDPSLKEFMDKFEKGKG